MKETQAIIKVESLSKVFKLPHEKLSTVKQHFVNIFNPKSFEKFRALDDVSFEVKKGEFFGIIGANGSGKSTLLKILAGIYQPSEGKVTVHGSLSPFIELGVGFNPELTARENIYLNAAILGMSRTQTESKFDEIVKFSELKNFLDQKLKNFSSGMQVRLAFSIAVQAQADILLVDEVLAVGDAAFQEKCLNLFRDLKRQGKTIIFVSHALNIMEEFCDQVIYLNKGKVVAKGAPAEIILTYLKIASEVQSGEEKVFNKNKKKSAIKISNIKFFNRDGKEASVFQTGDCLKIRIFFEVETKVMKPVFGVAIYKSDGTHMTGPNTKTSGFDISTISKNGYLEYSIDKIPFLAGEYFVTVGIFNNNINLVYDFVDRAANFKLIPSQINQYGLLKLDESWNLYD